MLCSLYRKKTNFSKLEVAEGGGTTTTLLLPATTSYLPLMLLSGRGVECQPSAPPEPVVNDLKVVILLVEGVYAG